MKRTTVSYFKVNNLGLFTALIAASIIIAYLLVHVSYIIGFLIIAVAFGVPLVIKSLRDFRFGYLLLLFYSFFLFYIDRMIPVHLPVGIGVEALISLIVVGILVSRSSINWKLFNNPVTLILIISTIYGGLQVFNPNALSIDPWIYSLRSLIFNLLLFFITVIVLNSANRIKKFTSIWIYLSIIAALYGIYQQMFGYTNKEWSYINKIPGLLELVQNGGVIRKFSFFSDVSTFGLFMSFGCVFLVVQMLGPYSTRRRVFYLVGAVLLFLGMSYSGTRTATVMVPIGLVMYGLLNITDKRTLIFGALVSVSFLIFLYGPFYGPTAQRVRSAFEPTDDPSMNVRDRNRGMIQPYILDHPFGGGVFTTGGAGEDRSPGHELAGFPPDSGYLQTALELGWIGLIIELMLYFVVLRAGIINYYRIRDPILKVLYSGYVCAFFALALANYAQSALFQKPTLILVFAVFAIMPNLIKYDSDQKEDIIDALD